MVGASASSFFDQRAGALGGLERGLEIADLLQRDGQLVEGGALGVAQQRRRFAPFGQFPLQLLRLLEHAAHQLDRHALARAEFDRQLVHEVVGGLRRRRQRLLGPVALLLRDLLLLDGEAFGIDRRLPLPAREPGEHEQRPGRRPRQGQRAALLAHLLREQVLLRHAVDGGGEIGGQLGELGVALVGAVTVRTQVHPFRLARKAAGERRRQRHASRAGRNHRRSRPRRARRRSPRPAACPRSCARASRPPPC